MVQKQFPEIAFCLRVTVFRKTYSFYQPPSFQKGKAILASPNNGNCRQNKEESSTLSSRRKL
jgi:hypothetical protein